MAALNACRLHCVDYNCLGAINSNHTFDLNYLLWKSKTLKRQVVSFLLETKHKVFRFKTKPIPRMLVQYAKRSLKIIVANVQLSAKLQNTRPLLSIVNLLLPWSRSRVFEYTPNKHSLPSSAAPAVPQSFSRHILHITIPYRHHEMYVRFYERNTQTCLAIM